MGQVVSVLSHVTAEVGEVRSSLSSMRSEVDCVGDLLSEYEDKFMGVVRKASDDAIQLRKR